MCSEPTNIAASTGWLDAFPAVVHSVFQEVHLLASLLIIPLYVLARVAFKPFYLAASRHL